MSPPTGPATRGLQILAIPAAVSIILFLGYFSQYLFHTSPELAPGPLTRRESITFNALLLCLWYTYFRACTTDPGRFVTSKDAVTDGPSTTLPKGTSLNRWCKKCQSPKPPRAHHCRHCGRCIPKMDHHCPWTGNCVSHTVFPYFLRFLLFTNLSLALLASHLWTRFAVLWRERHLPAYLGPTLSQLVWLTVLALVCATTQLALGILGVTACRGWVGNCTMIEGWEIERHESLIGKPQSDWDDGDESDEDGEGGVVKRVEFPYDVGFWRNMSQAMGTSNPFMWFWPFAGGPTVGVGGGSGWEWEENGFNDREGMWPPPDPEKERRAKRGGWPGADAGGREEGPQLTPEEEKAAFLARQKRWATQRSGIIRELEEVDGGEPEDLDFELFEEQKARRGLGNDNRKRVGWKNSDGDTLGDYGVDEEAELVDFQDEDIPLGELLRRRRKHQATRDE